MIQAMILESLRYRSTQIILLLLLPINARLRSAGSPLESELLAGLGLVPGVASSL